MSWPRQVFGRFGPYSRELEHRGSMQLRISSISTVRRKGSPEKDLCRRLLNRGKAGRRLTVTGQRGELAVEFDYGI